MYHVAEVVSVVDEALEIENARMSSRIAVL